MSFWNENEAGKSFEIEGGNTLPIPDGTHVLAMISEAKWGSPRDRMERLITIRYEVLKPEIYSNRKVFQKLWVTDLDPNKKDSDKSKKSQENSRKFLTVIDGFCGGKLGKIARAKAPSVTSEDLFWENAEDHFPDDALAAALSGKMVVIGLRVWETTNSSGGDASGNWVYFVGDKASELKEGTVKASKPKTSLKREMDDSIPF